MKFRAFARWCNERACDGCWGRTEAIVCCDIMEKMKQVNPLARETVWKTINALLRMEELIVEPTNARIKEAFEADE